MKEDSKILSSCSKMFHGIVIVKNFVKFVNSVNIFRTLLYNLKNQRFHCIEITQLISVANPSIYLDRRSIWWFLYYQKIALKWGEITQVLQTRYSQNIITSMITLLIVIDLTPLTVIYCNCPLCCNCPLLRDISFNTNCLLVWCD